MIQFDVSAVPMGSTLNSVTLELYVQSKIGTLAQNFYLHSIMQGWKEMQATYQAVDFDEDWLTQGGTYDATILDSFAFPSGVTAGQWISLSVPLSVVQ